MTEKLTPFVRYRRPTILGSDNESTSQEQSSNREYKCEPLSQLSSLTHPQSNTTAGLVPKKLQSLSARRSSHLASPRDFGTLPQEHKQPSFMMNELHKSNEDPASKKV